MKKIILLMSLFFVGMTFAQNESAGSIATSITTPGPIPGETFRFGPGLVTQLDAGLGFGFTNDRWFSMGRLNTGSQTVYGMRFQLPNRAITMGYQDLGDANPRIQWIGAGSFASSDLEFRVANSFTSTSSTLVATMTNDGETFFGTPFSLSNRAKVGIDFGNTINFSRTGLAINNTVSASGTLASRTGISIQNSGATTSKTGIRVRGSGSGSSNLGVSVNLIGSTNNSGVESFVYVNPAGNTFGVKATAAYFLNTPLTGFGAAVQGFARTVPNLFAGYFDGNVFTTGMYLPSDEKLKKDIKVEENALEKLVQLNTVTYNFKELKELNLPREKQHGFLAQNLEEVFPELIMEINKPVYDKDNKQTGTFAYKAVNYNGMISVLASSLKELNEKSEKRIQQLEKESLQLNDKIEILEAKIASLTGEDASMSETLNAQNNNESEFSMEQNKPNPFTNRTVINYTLPRNTNATISVVDLSGKFVRDYNISGEKGQLVINSSEIGKGIFVYALISNDEVIMTKKMIVR
ncbi:MAG: tail fiber domain-containing protein [Bacteroidota bacterium]